MLASPELAGPWMTAPVCALNSEPWQGQAMILDERAYATVHPAWGHTASKATNFPAVCWMTRAGSPLDGSVKLAEPPTGTLASEPITVPDGAAAVVDVDAGVAAPGVVVTPGEVVDGEVVDAEVVDGEVPPPPQRVPTPP